jgi:hypothetical protein
MQAKGFEEAHSVYAATGARPFAGEVRQFGPHGPAYEVLEVVASGDVTIAVIATGERLTYALSACMSDPLAETIP